MNFATESAVLIDIHQESEKGFVQGVKKDEHSSSDNSLVNAAGQEDKYYVLKYKVLRPGQELFHYAKVEKFIRDYYLPKNKAEKMSANRLEEINKRLSNTKLDVVTRDFDETGAASVYATYLPQGFDSWNDYLKTIFLVTKAHINM